MFGVLYPLISIPYKEVVTIILNKEYPICKDCGYKSLNKNPVYCRSYGRSIMNTRRHSGLEKTRRKGSGL